MLFITDILLIILKRKKRYTNNIVTKKNEKGGVNVQQLNTLLRDWEPFCTKSYLVL